MIPIPKLQCFHTPLKMSSKRLECHVIYFFSLNSTLNVSLGSFAMLKSDREKRSSVEPGFKR